MEPNRGFTLWITGMIGAGKSALARYVAKRMPLIGRKVELLDHSELQDVLPEALDAPKEVRERNVRHLGWMARLLTKHDVVVIVAATSPDRELRDEQRRRIGRFAEVFVDCPFEILQERDEQGVYRKALSGEIQNVVGIHAPYEPPTNPETRVDTSQGGVEELAQPIFFSLFQHGFITAQERDILINGMGDARLAVVRASAAKADAGKARRKSAAKKAASEAKPAKTPAKAAARSSAKAAKAKEGAEAKAVSQAKGAAEAKKAMKAKAGAEAKKATRAKAGAEAKKAAGPKASPAAKKPASGTVKAKAKAPSKAAAGAPAKKPAKTAARQAVAKKAVAARAPAKAKPAAKTKKTAAVGKSVKAAPKAPKAASARKKVAAKATPVAGAKKGSATAKAKAKPAARTGRRSPRSASA